MLISIESIHTLTINTYNTRPIGFIYFMHNVRASIVHCTMYSVQCTMYSVQDRVYSIQCTACKIECTLYSVQCTAWNVNAIIYPNSHIGRHPPTTRIPPTPLPLLLGSSGYHHQIYICFEVETLWQHRSLSRWTYVCFNRRFYRLINWTDMRVSHRDLIHCLIL